MRTRASNSGESKRRMPLNQARVRSARHVLGPDHPLARATDLVRTFENQAGVVLAVIVMSAVGTAVALPVAPTVLPAALVVEFALAAALVFAREVLAERAWDIIVCESEGPSVREVLHERERLSDPRRREQLSRSLERALDSAERWHEILIASRPPEGVRLLSRFAPEIRLIVAQVRDGPADLRGIALLARLLTGGYGASLYSGDAEALRCELERITYLLRCPSSGPSQSSPPAAQQADSGRVPGGSSPKSEC